VRDGGRTVGLLVDDVHSVQRFAPGQFTPLVLAAGDRALSAGLLEANDGTLLVQELGVAAIFARLLGGGRTQAA
jgi:chemotaxis signal transduction protein